MLESMTIFDKMQYLRAQYIMLFEKIMHRIAITYHNHFEESHWFCQVLVPISSKSRLMIDLHNTITCVAKDLLGLIYFSSLL